MKVFLLIALAGLALSDWQDGYYGGGVWNGKRENIVYPLVVLDDSTDT